MTPNVAYRYRGFLPFALACLVTPALYAAPLFNTATGTPASTQPTVHYLQQITLPQTSDSYVVTGFSIFGLATSQPDGPRCQLVLNFYVDLDLNPNAADPLAGATLIGSQTYNVYLPVSPAVIAINFDQPFVAPRTLGVEASLRTEDLSNYSDIFQGRFTLNTPSLGTSPGFVWSDADRNGSFSGAEQTTFNSSVANIRMTLVGVPGPRISAINLVNGQPQITFSTISGRSYRVERKLGVSGFSWVAVTGASNIPGNNGEITASDPDPVSGTALYRVIML